MGAKANYIFKISSPNTVIQKLLITPVYSQLKIKSSNLIYDSLKNGLGNPRLIFISWI